VNRDRTLKHEFVDYLPSDPGQGTIYISMKFATAVHKCCCGCGGKVVTPLSPTDWSLTFDGETISLDPSIGNWSFGCKSHYWIRASRVRWARLWSSEEIEAVRTRDRIAKEMHFGPSATKISSGADTVPGTKVPDETAQPRRKRRRQG
jgi:uncharacterized protein DUF6527